MDFPGRLIAGLLVVVLILMFPLQYIAGLNNESIDGLVGNRTHLFSNSIREKGFIDKQMYEEYSSFLDTTGERYEIELQDIRAVKGEDISISEVNEKREIIPLRTNASNSIMASSMSTNEIQSFSAHAHTDDCYAGHRHNESCMSMPLIVKKIFSATWGSNSSIYTYIYCGYCNETIAVFEKTEPWMGAGTYRISTYSPNRQYYYYSQGTNPEFTTVNRQLEQLHRDIVPFNTFTQEGEGNGSTYNQYVYYIPAEYNNFEIPLCRTLSECFFCDGSEAKLLSVTKSYNDYDSTNRVGIKCLICNRRIALIEAQYNNYYNTTYYRLYIYDKSGNQIYSNTNKEQVLPIYNEISKYSGNFDYRHPMFQFSLLNQAIYHGCGYPSPACQIPEDATPICDRVVTSIAATNPTQTVKKGETITTTAIATYLDGHTGLVNCTSNFNSNQLGNQIVTLTYSGLVGNAKTTGTRTCTLNVTVLPVKNLTSITVLPEYQTIERYSLPVFTVRANYDDGTSIVLSSSEYSVSGFNDVNIGIQRVAVTYTEGEITKAATANVKVTALMNECLRCNQIYELNPDDTDPGCPYCRELIVGIEVTPNYVEVTGGDILPITVMGIYNDGTKGQVTGWISNFDSERIGLQIVTVQYQGYAADITVWVSEGLVICPICDTPYPTSEDSCPVCTEKVIRIEVLPKELTIMQFDPIPLTVTAYHADGSSRVVDDWAIDRTSVTPGTFIATVSYKGVFDSITLTVLSLNSIECPICYTIYDLSESPKGCPICSEEIIGIEAYLTSGTNLVQLGTNPTIAVILIFRDEHREFARDGYELENYNPQELGIQTVRVLYKGFATTIIIEVVNRLDAITCPNGHVYYKNSDGTDPGCPFCHEDYDISKIAYFDITYTTEIVDTLYSTGVYHFHEGNYISVIVIKKDTSLLFRLQNTFFSTSILGRKKRFIYGGEVKG
jgi:DNA-directed RNA polymerase subunit RPC12/RpoP